MKRLALLAVILVTSLGGMALPGVAQAEPIQKDGPEAWPGKVMIGVAPLGVSADFTNHYNGYIGYAGDGYGSYKFGFNVAGIIADMQKLTIWLGGELNFGGRAYFAQVEPGIFVQFTLEKLLRIPLVPIITAGVSGPIFKPYGAGNPGLGGAFELKIGVGVYYFLTRHIGLGAETHLAFGPGFVDDGFGGHNTIFGGYFDFLAGAKFAF